jgi:hypothetical protein
MTSLHVLLQPWGHVDAIKAASMPKPYWFWRGGIEVYAGFKNRHFWTASSGLKHAACHVLAALSTLQQRPYVPLSDSANMDLYV